MRRRQLLLAAAAASLAACDELPPEALAAWAGPPTGLGDPVAWAVAWASLAPSLYNSQPWQVERHDGNRLALRLDRSRLVPVADPTARQAQIACGAFLELVTLALAAQGQAVAIEPGFSGGTEPLAWLAVRPGPAAVDPLFPALPRRRSSALAFDPEKPIKAEHRAALQAASGAGPVRFGIVDEPEPVRELRDDCLAAIEASLARPDVLAEQAAWLRLGPEAAATRADGLPRLGASSWWLRRLGLETPESLGRSHSLPRRLDRLAWRNTLLGTASFGWLATPGDEPAHRVAAGRLYQRLDLACAAHEVAIHPLAAPVEEGAPLRRLLALDPSWRVQMLFRLGYAGPVPPTPRRPLAQIMSEA